MNAETLALSLAERLQSHRREVLHIAGFRPAAVCVPLLDTPEGPSLLFTVRSDRLRHHAGQIAFPGGGGNDGESPEETALRETREEIGLKIPAERVLGRLDDQLSPAGYVVTPVVALASWPQPLELDLGEVRGVFTACVHELACITPTAEVRRNEKFERTLYCYALGDKNIWGLTGNVLRTLLKLLDFRAGRT